MCLVIPMDTEKSDRPKFSTYNPTVFLIIIA